MEQASKPPEVPKPKKRTMTLVVIVIAILIVVGVGVYLALPRSTGPTVGEHLTIWDTNGACLQSASPADCGFKDSNGNSNVTITVGTTVQWTNNSPSLPHTVTTCDSTNSYTSYTSSGACPHGANSSSVTSFTSGNMNANGATYEYTFNTAGTYYYFCTVHPWMNGEIIVH